MYDHRTKISFHLMDSFCSAYLESCIEKYLWSKK